MTKRSTIGTNPLDEDIQNPLEATIPDQLEGTEQSTYQPEKQEKVSSSDGEPLESTPVLHTRDAATQNPPASLQSGSTEKPEIHREDVAQPSRPEIEVLPPSSKMPERLAELEEENLCLKWALGLILAPLVLLALLG